jgi:hypothetical protein
MDRSALKIRLKNLAMSRVRFGYRRLLVLRRLAGGQEAGVLAVCGTGPAH